MPTIYKRNCNYCNKYYEGQGDKYCSYSCRNSYMNKTKIKKLSDGTFYPSIPDLCWCHKCNEIVYGGKRFIDGHESIGRKASKETRNKQSVKAKMRSIHCCHSDETKIKLLIASTKICLYDSEGNKEIYPHIPTICYCMRPSCYEICWQGNWIRGHQHIRKSSWNKNKHWDDIIKIKMRKPRLSMCGAKNPNFGKPKSDLTIQKISKSLKELYKDTRNHPQFGKFGELNNNWRGGTGKYCHKFNFHFKESIRYRDSRICQNCSKSEKENGRRLDVHHIHHDKPNCYPDCIALCRSCNIKIENKKCKKYFENLFMNKLNDRELLFWARRRENQI